MTEILKAKPVIKNIYSRIKNEIEEKNISLKLVIILVGDDPAAKYYVQNLEKKGSKIGIEVETIKFSSHISPKELLNEINLLNNNETVHGIMIQKPLPKNFDEYKINFSINPNKDVDAFHPINLGNLLLGNESFVPCTPAAVIEMIKYHPQHVHFQKATTWKLHW